MHMFEIFGEAARWEIDSGYYMLMSGTYLLMTVFYMLALLSIVLLAFVTLKKDSLYSKRSKFTRGLITITSFISIFLGLFDLINFYFDSYNWSVAANLYSAVSLVFIISSATLLAFFYKFLFRKKIFLYISFFVMIISTSIFCLPIAIDNYQELHQEYHCDCEDKYIEINGRRTLVPCCPM